jgi:hypothetical protein
MQIPSWPAGLSASFTDVPERLAPQERASLYRHVFGTPGGTPGPMQPNHEFESLWLRLLSSVAQTSARALHRSEPALSVEHVRGAARELAARLTARLPMPIEPAHGAGDLWQLVDRVATTELGGARQAQRHRALAEAGGAVLEWLGRAADEGRDTSQDLQQHAEQWLAVAVTQDGDIEALSQPAAARDRIAAWSSGLHAALGLDADPAAPDRRAPRVAALFSDGCDGLSACPSGTGKTLAAHWLAAERGVDLTRIELAQVAGKYIGETEKHLDAVFADAARRDAVLLFDEADALFGKRSDVRDAHDRHANQEVSYLLRRIEAYDGIVIVTTNSTARIDPDLLKRLRHVVFPLPVPPRGA